MRFDTPQLPTLLEGMQKIANRIFVGLVLAGVLVASGLMSARYPSLAMIGFAIAGALGLYMVLSIVVTDRHRKK